MKWQFWLNPCLVRYSRKSTTVLLVQHQIIQFGPFNHGIVLTPQVWWHLPTKQLALHHAKHVVPTMPLPEDAGFFSWRLLVFEHASRCQSVVCISPFLKIDTQLPPGSSVCEITFGKKFFECVPPNNLTTYLKLAKQILVEGKEIKQHQNLNARYLKPAAWHCTGSPHKKWGGGNPRPSKPPNHTESRQHSSLLLKAWFFVS